MKHDTLCQFVIGIREHDWILETWFICDFISGGPCSNMMLNDLAGTTKLLQSTNSIVPDAATCVTRCSRNENCRVYLFDKDTTNCRIFLSAEVTMKTIMLATNVIGGSSKCVPNKIICVSITFSLHTTKKTHLSKLYHWNTVTNILLGIVRRIF